MRRFPYNPKTLTVLREVTYKQFTDIGGGKKEEPEHFCIQEAWNFDSYQNSCQLSK